MNEVGSGFRRFGFPVVWIRRRAGAQYLPGNVITRARVWQAFGQVNYGRSKFLQPVLQVKFSTFAGVFIELPDIRPGIPILGRGTLHVGC